MMTTISNNEHWNNISVNQSFDIDDLFSSSFNFIHQNEYDNDFISIKNDNKEIVLSFENNQEYSQILPNNNSIQESQLLNLECRVCGASAQGYNFDQITCNSCKAFFRRNALRDMSKLQCRFSGSCIIDIYTRRQCTYCRLKKCFDIKMRKDWIRTDEEKQIRQFIKLTKEQKNINNLANDQQSLINLPLIVRKKKRKIIRSINQELVIKPILTQIFFGFNRNLSNNDQILLNNITNAYQLRTNDIDDFYLNRSISSTSIIKFFNEESIMHESLIYFYKSIPEFKQLDIHDQVLLIKSNLIKIIHLHYILQEKFQENPYISLYMSKWINKEFHYQMSRTRRYFDRFIEHPLILKLALIVFLFNINLSISYNNHQFNDYNNKMNIYKIQEFYIILLWRYLNYLFKEQEAIKSMEIIITKILHFQNLMNIMEENIRQEVDCNTLNQLMQSLFQLT
ncbi:unnamed protein product [Rotaria sordida]|uniref:Nuclear receptor domain-containing protein n=1 Tax=Rotaria sordida TaxID=392033 RepID=A0A814VCA5_9BILA|nr:unnamed protein product [Rotaria sordida]